MNTLPVRLGVCVLALISVVPIRAEVSTDAQGPVTSTLIMGIISEDPDPIGALVWQAFRPIAAERILNPDGFLRGDGRPDATTKPDGSPVVAWAYDVGPDHDVVIAEWNDNAWGAIGFVSGGGDDDLDPRLAVEADGTAHVVWWTDGTELVWLRTRPAGATAWGAAVLVTYGGEHGRRPSVLVEGAELRVAYERTSTQSGMSQDAVVATREAGGGFALEVIASTTRVEPLDPLLHREGSVLWLDWKHDAGEFGSAKRAGESWIMEPTAIWADPSWVGVEETRQEIRRRMLGP